MRIVMFGTPGFAVPVLDALLASRHQVAAVYTMPDKRKDRSGKPSPSPVKEAASRACVERICCSERLSRKECEPVLAGIRADAGVVAAYGVIFRPWIFPLFRHGLINVHPSLLPRHRGPAPVSGAILSGDEETGVSIMQLDAGVDTGGVLLAESCRIGSGETTGELEERLSLLAPGILLRALDGVEDGTLRPVPQDDSKATFTRMLTKDDGAIDWSVDAKSVHRLVMAVNPWPGASASFRGGRVIIWRTALLGESRGPAGSLFFPSKGRLAACAGFGAVELIEVQKPGGKRLSAQEFINGSRIAHGECMS